MRRNQRERFERLQKREGADIKKQIWKFNYVVVIKFASSNLEINGLRDRRINEIFPEPLLLLDSFLAIENFALKFYPDWSLGQIQQGSQTSQAPWGKDTDWVWLRERMKPLKLLRAGDRESHCVTSMIKIKTEKGVSSESAIKHLLNTCHFPFCLSIIRHWRFRKI